MLPISFVDIKSRKPVNVDLEKDISVLEGMAILYDSRFRVNMPDNISGGEITVNIYDFEKKIYSNPEVLLETCETAQNLVDHINEEIIYDLKLD